MPLDLFKKSELSKLLYSIFLLIYSIGVRIASIWNPKGDLWVKGREGIFGKIESEIKTLPSKPIWMHCASLGEFEQGRPLLEELKRNDPSVKIVLSFFSPSGYEVMKNYAGVDFIFYLPMDSPINAKRFIDAINPSLVLWVKYEYWFYYLKELKQRNIPTILVSGIFRKNHPFFKWYGKIWVEMLNAFSHFFVQNEESKELLSNLGFNDNVTVNGDTRFDRVLEIAQQFQAIPFISEFCGNSIVIVAGSTWEEDEIELMHFIKVNPQMKFIIAPHEINAENLEDVREMFPDAHFYSQLTSPPIFASNILIIDNIGMLSRLYQYATIAYVGGGFGKDGVHNVLEAAVYAKPVVFGPEFEKYEEAIGLIETGGAISVEGPLGLESVLNEMLKDKKVLKERGDVAVAYVKQHKGASKKIIQFIQEKRLLIS